MAIISNEISDSGTVQRSIIDSVSFCAPGVPTALTAHVACILCPLEPPTYLPPFPMTPLRLPWRRPTIWLVGSVAGPPEMWAWQTNPLVGIVPAPLTGPAMVFVAVCIKYLSASLTHFPYIWLNVNKFHMWPLVISFSLCLSVASGGWQEPENPHTQRVGFMNTNKKYMYSLHFIEAVTGSDVFFRKWERVHKWMPSFYPLLWHSACDCGVIVVCMWCDCVCVCGIC